MLPVIAVPGRITRRYVFAAGEAANARLSLRRCQWPATGAQAIRARCTRSMTLHIMGVRGIGDTENLERSIWRSAD